LFSLSNLSNEVRWSLDLRWQHPSEPDGLWGLKKPVVMRQKDKPDMEIDWTEFDSVDRHSEQKKALDEVRVCVENLPETVYTHFVQFLLVIYGGFLFVFTC